MRGCALAIGLWCLGAFSGALVGTAHAADDEATATARRLFKAGTQDYEKGRYREAISEFEAAYRAKPHPSLFYNLAKTHEKLGELPGALADYDRYLQQLPDAPDRGEVEASVARIESRLSDKGRQALLITTEPAGATVSVDGQERGHTPFAGEVAHGAHTVEVALLGFKPVRKEVLAQPGASLRLTLTLERLAKEPKLEPETPPAKVAQPLPEAAVHAPEETAHVERHRTWTWVVAGTTGAALVAATTLAILAEQDRKTYLSAPHSGTTNPTVQQLYDGANGKHVASNVLFGVSAAAGAATVGLFFVEGRF